MTDQDEAGYSICPPPEPRSPAGHAVR